MFFSKHQMIKAEKKNNHIVLQKIWNQHCIKLNKFLPHKRNEGEKPGQKNLLDCLQ